MLYGRDAERALIRELLEAAGHSRSSVLVIRGVPGVGKTALLDDAREAAREMQVLTARGVESEAQLPFAGLHQLLAPILGHLDEIPPPQADALGVALGLRDGDQSEPFLVFAGCLSLLAAAAEQTPVLCVIDDAHWLDPASSDALLFVARRVAAEGIVIVIAARESEGVHLDVRGLTSLTLGGLEGDAAVALLEKRAGPRASTDVCERLIEQTGGNALALLELPTALTDEQLIGTQPLPDALPLTGQVEAAFLERTARLPQPAQRLLLVAAAEATGDLGTVLRAAESFGVDAEALTAVEEAGLLRVAGTRFEFRHPLVRSALYGSAPSVLRRSAHAALAEAMLRDEAHADRRAWHLASAAVEPDAAVVAALEDAGRRAEARTGYLAAARAYERAAELSEARGERGRRLVAAARATNSAGRELQAAALAAQAEPLVDDPVLLAEIARVKGEAVTLHGRPADVVGVLMEAARGAALASPVQALELLMAASRAAVESGDTSTIAEVGQITAQIAVDPSDETAVFMHRLLDGLCAMWIGDMERGAAPLMEAVAWAETSEDPRHLSWAGRASIFLGDDARTSSFLQRSADGARARGAVGLLTNVLGLRAAQLYIANHFDEASVGASEALAIARELGTPNLIPMPSGVLALIAAVRGREAEVRERVAEVKDIAGSHGLAMPATEGVWAQATLDLALGDWQRAFDGLAAVTEARPGFGNAVIALSSAPDRVEAAFRAGRPDDARAALAPFESWAEHTAMPWAQPTVAKCRALLLTDDEATQEFERAVSLSADARPLDAARTRLLFGEHLRRQRRRADARAQLRAAVDGFEALGATPWAERSRAELRATGESTHKRDPAALAELTPQELQVARLVADGLSNKEVAAHLFLSPRTIDAHLRSVFSKLGVTSRTQLARHAVKFGDIADARSPAPA